MSVTRPRSRLLLIPFLIAAVALFAPSQVSATSSGTDLAYLVQAVDAQANEVGNSPGVRRGFESFLAEYKLSSGSVRYSDYVVARLLYEATRDAGFWGVNWAITNKPPNSDRIWQQWAAVKEPSFTKQTATAECDELSALYAFLAGRAGVHGVGLFWPYPNHTVAVWVLHPAENSFVRVVIPTSQIFLTESDDFGTRTFNPWTQKTIYEYTRRDVPDTFEVPKPLFDFFIQQMKKYGGASDGTLQKIRYLRDAVFRREWSPEKAAQAALMFRAEADFASDEDSAGLKSFAQDMRSASRH
jgi:hypothetical protein